MSYILVDYKGLQVVSPDPVGDGGLALNSNFRTVADYMEDPDFSLVKIYGSTSGYVGLVAAAAAGSTTYTLPSADGTSGQALVTNGSGVTSWSTVTTPPSGSSGYVQFNNGSGGFGGDSEFFWDHTNKRLQVKNTLRLYGATSGYIGLVAAAAAGSTTYTLPSADGTSGQALVTNGSGVLSFSTVATPPGGSSGYVQFNNGSGGFGGDSGLFWDHSTARLGIGTVVPSSVLTVLGDVRVESASSYAKFIKSDTSNQFSLKNYAITAGGLGTALNGTGTWGESSFASITGNFSVSVWLYRTDTVGSSDNGIIDCGSYDDSSGFGIWIKYTSIGYRINGNYNNYNYDLPLNTWTHIVITYDGSNVKTYANGSLYSSAAYGVNPNAFNSVVIGRRRGWGNYPGYVDEPQIYNIALDQTAITALYNGGGGVYGTPTTGLVGGWHLDEGSGATAADYSGNAYNLTLNNSSGWVTGYISVPGSLAESYVLKCVDGGTNLETGVITLGDTVSRTVLDGQTLRFNIAGTEKARVTAAGLMGIGTSAPGSMLQINTSAAAVKGLIVKGYTSQSANLQEWQDSTGAIGACITAAKEFSNGTNGSERFGSGAAATGGLSCAFGASSTASTWGTAYGYSTSATYGGSVALGCEANVNSGGIAIGWRASTTAETQFVAGSRIIPVNDVYFGSGVIAQNIYGWYSSFDCTINGSGGSGTDAVGANISLAGGIATGNAVGGSILFKTSNAGVSSATPQSLTTKMTILASGFVGIGTPTPATLLHLYGTIPMISLDANSATGWGSGIYFERLGVPKWYQQVDSQNEGTNQLDFDNTSGDVVLSLLQNRNVGIQTTTPTANLQVVQPTTSAGTVSVSGTAVTGVGTQFLNTFKVGDTITVTTTSGVETKAITVVNNDTSLTTAAFAGTAAAGTAYTLVGGTRFSVFGNGNVAIPTDLLLGSTATSVLKKSFSSTIYKSITWAGEEIPIFEVSKESGITVTQLNASTMGTTPELTFNLEERTYGSLSSSGTNLMAASAVADADGVEVTSFTHATIAAKSHIVLVPTGGSPESGTVNLITLLVSYTQNL